jgi:putative ABC transport system permease protein
MLPLSYNVRSLTVRKGTTLAAVVGIALVTFLFAAVFMLQNGLQDALGTSGRSDNAVVLRQGSDAELSSNFEADRVNLIGAKDLVARGPSGASLAIGENIGVVLLHKKGTDGFSNVQVRGTSGGVWDLRPEAKIIAGRKPQPGTDEVAIGKGIRGSFEGCDLDQSFDLKKNRPVKVVGIFATGGSSFESEVWADIDFVRAAFGREGIVSSARVHLTSASKFDAFKADVESDKTLGLQVMRETVYYEKQAEQMGPFLLIFGLVISFFFSLGAIIGAAITMYAQVSSRTKEIGTLRALGFSRGAILISFVVESILVAAAGGALGVLLSFIMGSFTFSILNFATWSEIVIRFSTSPGIIVGSFLFAIVMGILGGFLPALRAAFMSPLAAIRD